MVHHGEACPFPRSGRKGPGAQRSSAHDSEKAGAALQGDALAPPRVEPGGRVKPVTVPPAEGDRVDMAGVYKAERAVTLRRRAAGRKAALIHLTADFRPAVFPIPKGQTAKQGVAMEKADHHLRQPRGGCSRRIWPSKAARTNIERFLPSS